MVMLKHHFPLKETRANWLILGVQQEMYKRRLKHSIIPKSKVTIKDYWECVDQTQERTNLKQLPLLLEKGNQLFFLKTDKSNQVFSMWIIPLRNPKTGEGEVSLYRSISPNKWRNYFLKTVNLDMKVVICV